MTSVSPPGTAAVSCGWTRSSTWRQPPPARATRTWSTTSTTGAVTERARRRAPSRSARSAWWASPSSSRPSSSCGGTPSTVREAGLTKRAMPSASQTKTTSVEPSTIVR